MASNNYSNVFYKAVCKDDIAELEQLFTKEDYCKSNFKIDAPIKCEFTALHLAIARKNVDMVRMLLEHGADITLRDENGENCLEIAAKLGEHDIVNLCLQSVDYFYNLKYPIECTVRPLNINPKYVTSGPDILDIFKFLLRNKADANPRHHCVDACSTDIINPPLFSLLLKEGPASGDIQLVISLAKLLVEYGADPNFENCYGVSPFSLSFCFNDPDFVCFLIDHGADIKYAMFLAVTCEMFEVVQKLIDLNVSVNGLLMLNSDDNHYGRLLHLPMLSAKMMKFLVERGADVNALSSGNLTPLGRAAHYQNLEGIRYLLKMGADVNGHKENNPLLMAANTGFYESVIQLLLDHGASVNGHDKYGRSLLYHWMRLVKRQPKDRVILRYIKLVIARGVTLTEADIDVLQDWQISLLQTYQQEINNMKEVKVCKDSTTTYFDMLMKRRSRLVNCLQSEGISKAMASGLHLGMFEHFSYSLEKNYKNGLVRMPMLKKLLEILYEIFKDFIPYEIIVLITDFLDNKELSDILG